MAGPATGHFRRDQAGDLVITGANLGTATSVELVDAAGNAIAGHTALAPGANGQVTVAATTITINNNATWYTAAGDANETDTITALGRRIKITTPSGTVTTPADITGAFTISAEPLLAVTGTVFAGGGFAAGNATYNPGVGALLINDTGVDPLANGTTDGNAVPLKGIKQIELISDSVVATTLTSGWTVNAAGNQITIPAATAQLNGWSDAGGLFNRTVRLTTAADQTATTPAIRTEP